MSGSTVVDHTTNQYQVQQGDTLWRIANKTGISIDQLARENGVDAENIQAGMQLTIPTTPVVDPSATPGSAYAQVGGPGTGQGAPTAGQTPEVINNLQALTRRDTPEAIQVANDAVSSEFSRTGLGATHGDTLSNIEAARTAASAGVTDVGELIRIDQVYGDAASQLTENNGRFFQESGEQVIADAQATAPDGRGLLGATHEETRANVANERATALEGVTDQTQRNRIGASYDSALGILDANNDAYLAGQDASSVNPQFASTTGDGVRAFQLKNDNVSLDVARVDGGLGTERGLGFRLEGSVADVSTQPPDGVLNVLPGDVRVQGPNAGVQLGHTTLVDDNGNTESTFGVRASADVVTFTKGIGRLEQGGGDARLELSGSLISAPGVTALSSLADKDNDGHRELGLEVGFKLGIGAGVRLELEQGSFVGDVAVGAAESVRDGVDTVRNWFGI